MPLIVFCSTSSFESYTPFYTLPPFLTFSDLPYRCLYGQTDNHSLHQHGETVLSGSGRLGLAEVFDAEAKGALEGLRAALSIQEILRNNVIICLNNLAIVAYF